MWPRHLEVMLAFWLALAPFIFGAGSLSTGAWLRHLIGAAVMIIASLTSYWDRTRRAHLITLAVALGLGLHAYLQPRPLDALAQNQLTVALLLVILAIIPGEASLPPLRWRRYEREHAPP